LIPSRRLFFALALVSVGIAGAVAVDWLFPLCLFLDLSLVVLAVIDARLAARAPLRVSRNIPALLSLGRSDEIEVLLQNPGGRTLQVLLRDGLHPDLAAEPPLLRTELPPGATLKWKLQIRPRERGRHRLFPLSARVLGPLGLAWNQRDFKPGDAVTVYPRIHWGGEVGRMLRMARQHQLGEIVWRHRGTTGEIYALREYLRGDPMRRIHWKASARHGRLIVREDSLERGNSIFIMLDAGRAMKTRLTEYSTKFDEALAAALVISRVAAGRGDRTSILAYSDRIEAMVNASGGRNSVMRAYQRLYDLHARLVEPAFDLAVARLLELDRRRGLVIILTSMADLVALEQLEEGLHRLRRRHQVLLVNLEDPEIEALALGAPSTEEEAFAKTSALQILLANRKAARKFRSGGIRISSTPASRFAAAALSGYLDAIIGNRGRRRSLARISTLDARG